MNIELRIKESLLAIQFSIDAMVHYANTYGYLHDSSDIMRITYKHHSKIQGAFYLYFPGQKPARLKLCKMMDFDKLKGKIKERIAKFETLFPGITAQDILDTLTIDDLRECEM